MPLLKLPGDFKPPQQGKTLALVTFAGWVTLGWWQGTIPALKDTLPGHPSDSSNTLSSFLTTKNVS